MIKGKKSKLAKRYQASYETKDSGSGSNKGVMDWKKVDGDVVFFAPQEGKNRINIIPYEIKTKNHPLVKKGEFEVGDKDYVMDFFVHRGVGPTEASVICLKNTFGKPCPICEQMALLNKQGKEEEAKAFKAQRRVIYNVEDLKEPGKVKVFETSHYLFEKELIDEARDDEEGGFVDFADPEEGKEIKFRASETSFGGRKYKEFKSFSFEDRDEPLDEELLENAISFDEIMSIPTYEEAQKILYGQEDDDSDEDEKPKKSSKKVADEDDEPAPAKKSKHREEDEGDEDGEEYEVPKKSSKKVVEEDDDEIDDEDDEPKKACKGDCEKCPFGHNFGKDVDEYDDCDDCDVWDKCVKAN